MEKFRIGRRTMLAGLAAAAAAPQAFAAGTQSPIAHGVLADNPLAQAFEKSRRDLPDVTLVGPDGEFDISFLKGRTILMPLWAEWCPQCLSELPDFAKLHAKFGGDKFAVMPVLTATGRKMTPPVIASIFKMLHAEALSPIVEEGFGDKLFKSMCRSEGRLVLPCNLLIAPDLTVVAREIGRLPAEDSETGDAPPKNGDPETVRRALAGQAQSLWGKQAGEDFAKAMIGGFLG